MARIKIRRNGAWVYADSGAAIATNKQNAIVASSAAPQTPSVGDLWIDTTELSPILKRWDGTSWVRITPDISSKQNTLTSSNAGGGIEISNVSGTSVISAIPEIGYDSVTGNYYFEVEVNE